MSNKTAAAVAAMVMAVAAAPLPAEAHKGLSEKQVKALIKRETAKIIRQIAGPAGPAGPAGMPGTPGGPGAVGPAGAPGMDAMPFKFAHVDSDGIVDPNRSAGITQENVRLDEQFFEGPASANPDGSTSVSVTYCFIGLPPVMGAQVIPDGSRVGAAVVSPKLSISNDPDPNVCPVQVEVHGFEQFPGEGREPPIYTSFYILLY